MNTMIFNAQDEFDTNPFGLKEQIEEWLVEKLQDGGHTHPLHALTFLIPHNHRNICFVREPFYE